MTVTKCTDLGLKNGFESPDLDRPGRLPHQQGLCLPLSPGRARDHPVMEIVPNKSSLSLSLSLSLSPKSPQCLSHGGPAARVLGLRSVDTPRISQIVPNKALSLSLSLSLRPLVFGGCAFPPVSLGPAGDCPCKD